MSATSSIFYGYFGGGVTPPAVSPTVIAALNRLDFSTDVVSNPTTFPAAKYNWAATSSSSYGYFGGGIQPTPTVASVSSIDRLDFSTEVISTPPSVLSEAKNSLSAVSNSN